MRLIPAALVLAFTIYCVLDVVRTGTSDVRGLPKPFWVVVVLVAPVVGGIAWLLAGRPRAARLPGTRRPGPSRPPVLGPDDDPDFLRTIDRPRSVPPAAPLDRTAPPPAGPAPATPPGTPAAAGPDGPAEERPARGTGRDGGAPAERAETTDEDPGTGTTAGTDDRRP